MLNSPWIRTPDFHNIKSLNYDDYWKFRGWELNKKLKSREVVMFNIVPTGAKVLDIGCGNSLLPVRLKEKGCDVTVADVSSLVLDQYQKFGLSGEVIDLNQVSNFKTEKKYDYIILSEVLEHMANPEEIIQCFKKYTNNFLITVPNSASYQFRYGLMFRGRFFTQWVHHPSEHLRYWSHIDFLDWLEALDLKVLSSPVAEGFSLRGRLPWLPGLWKNLLGYRMVYYCKVN